jgi:hypothetical protein|tara:strand:+ start:457 stop:675 length:219 start_codon:yes stop_codon:yes gene_type:complete
MQYEIKSGRTLYMTNASSSIQAVQNFKVSVGNLPVDSVHYIGNISVLDNVINNFEKEKESYFDYWTFNNGKH